MPFLPPNQQRQSTEGTDEAVAMSGDRKCRSVQHAAGGLTAGVDDAQVLGGARSTRSPERVHIGRDGAVLSAVAQTHDHGQRARRLAL